MAAASQSPSLADLKAWRSAIQQFELEYGSKIVDQIKQNKTTKPEQLLGFIDDRRQRESRSKFSTLMSNVSSHGQRFERYHAALDVLAQGIPFGCILWGSIRVVLEVRHTPCFISIPSILEPIVCTVGGCGCCRHCILG